MPFCGNIFSRKQNTREKIYRYSLPDTEANERGKRIEEPLVSDQVTQWTIQ